MVIVGTVIDDTMQDNLRVTMIATGLGAAREQSKRPPELKMIETPEVVQRTGTDGYGVHIETIDYEKLDQPAVVRRRVSMPPSPSASFDAADIPAFLRKQAD
jgi:cell division protein FtsZ